MRATFEAEIVARVVAGLLDNGVPTDTPFAVRIRYLNRDIRWTYETWPEEPTPPPTRWPEFSPLEGRIVACLRGRSWMVTADLAKALGEEPGTEFRVIVRNLDARGVVETNQKNGVRLVEPQFVIN